MLFIQLTGLSGAGKTSIANGVKAFMSQQERQFKIEVIDADDYRKTVCKDLGFTKNDRMENGRRLGKIAGRFAAEGSIAIVASISPYEDVRAELRQTYDAKIVWIKCALSELIKRDTKGLYRRALMDANNGDRISNLSGVSDTYEIPENADLVIDTEVEDLPTSIRKLYEFALAQLR